MRRAFPMIAACTVFLPAIVAAGGLNPKGRCLIVEERRPAAQLTEFVLSVGEMKSVKAIEVLVAYEGSEINQIEFIPSDYLNKPLVTPIVREASSQTLMFSICATGRVVSRTKDAVLGVIRFSSARMRPSIEVIGLRVVDEDFGLDEFGRLAATSRLQEVPEPHQSVGLPVKFAVHRAFPNPANPTVSVRYDVPASGQVTAGVYDVSGRLIWAMNDDVEPGFHTLEWNGHDSAGASVASGVYFLRLRWGAEVQTQKVLILK